MAGRKEPWVAQSDFSGFRGRFEEKDRGPVGVDFEDGGNSVRIGGDRFEARRFCEIRRQAETLAEGSREGISEIAVAEKLDRRVFLVRQDLPAGGRGFHGRRRSG